MIHFSPYYYKIQTIHSDPGYTWIFLPGGPGLGSTYLAGLCKELKLPGTTLLVDFPKDGTNHEGTLDFTFWKRGLIDLVSRYEHPILVAHSFAAMFILDTPEIEAHLAGLVLMNTSTHNTFASHMGLMRQHYNLPDLVPAAANYHLAPSVSTYKAFWKDYKYYCFTLAELPYGEKLLPLFAYNINSYQYAIEHFYIQYQCHWYPSIPTLTIASALDYICPATTFTEHPGFQKPTTLNTIIPHAGHFPWVRQMAALSNAFQEFITLVHLG